MKRGYVDTSDGQIHYRFEGTGEPLLLLHQVGLSSDQFTEVIPLLAMEYSVLAMDIPGYGNSYLPNRYCSIPDYARSVIQFLDTLGIAKTNVVGHLLGALVAVEMEATFPGHIDRLVLSTCPYMDRAEQKARQANPPAKPMEIAEDGSHLSKWWQYRAAITPYLKPEQWQRMLADYLRSGLGTRTEDGHKAMYAYDTPSKLPLTKSPTLLVYGAQDPFYKKVESTRSLIPRCRVTVIEGAHNLAMWEKPQEFARGVLEFLKAPGV